MTKHMMAKAVSEYFASNGGSMDLVTYKSKGADVPVKDFMLRRAFGSWNRVLSVVEHRYPATVVTEVKKAEVKKAPAKKAPAKKVEKKDVK
jgi:hypothetical protein|tara:strand:- start:61 stop:333 length:273 start_codon:yes stop_codon:yes gene_type:complete